MATKTWKITDLQREVADGYVYKASYSFDGKDGDKEWGYTGIVDLPRPASLVPYADLTETVIIGWVKSKLDNDKDGTVAAMEEETPSSGNGVPW
tara:strand:- start:469 stop:750 length:282 start_codon:yes stop_codon:yes gene_type:complete